MTKQTSFTLDESGIEKISLMILDAMEEPVIVSMEHPKIVPVDNAGQLLKQNITKLTNDFYNESGAYWSFYLGEKKYFSELIYECDDYWDGVYINSQKSPVFEYSPVICPNNIKFGDLSGRIALFYKGENDEFIKLYQNIAREIKKIVKLRQA